MLVLDRWKCDSAKVTYSVRAAIRWCKLAPVWITWAYKGPRESVAIICYEVADLEPVQWMKLGYHLAHSDGCLSSRSLFASRVWV